MGLRGRKPLISHNDRVQELIKHEIFDASGSLKKENDPIWDIICTNLNKKHPNGINKRNLYLYLSCNRNNVIINVKNLKNILNTVDEVLKNDEKQSEKETESELIKIQNNVLYRPVIKELSVHPLTIFHWSKSAISYASDVLDKNDLLYFHSVDKICDNFVKPDLNCSNNISLHSLSVCIDENLLPICQMTSEKCTKAILSRFLLECLRDGLVVPTCVFVSGNKDRILTANKIFNKFLPYEEYLSNFFACLNKNQDMQNFPPCTIKSNIKYLLDYILNRSSIKNIPSENVKFFYTSLVFLLHCQTQLDNFKEILKNILNILLSKFKSDLTQQSFCYLSEKLKILNINKFFLKNILKDFNETSFEEDDYFYFEQCNDIMTFFNRVKIRSYKKH